MKFHTIKSAKPVGEFDPKRLRMQIEFGDDPNAVVDLTAIFAQGGVFAPLCTPARFAAVEVEEDGRALLWRVGEEVVDLCADALWLMAHPEDNPTAMGPPA
jgi:Protein of unknown function (DUF2442)